MKLSRKTLLILLVAMFTVSAYAQKVDSVYIQNNYEKSEYFIEMRDGAKLFTIVYTPKDQSKKYPILMNRTCYNASEHGRYITNGSPSDYLVRDGYILVYQDVRGRYMSDGVFDNMTPNIPGNDPKNLSAVDESSDTWDSVEWLVNNVSGNNGRVGIYGISYPGYYSTASLPDAHKAIKAVSPQAPIADFFFDDFHHHGAFLQSYTPAFAVFGYQKEELTRQMWFMDKLMRFFTLNGADGYEFNMELGPLKNVTEKFHFDNFFWNQIVEHPNYDKFWQDRNILPHLKNIKPAVMTVGGWYDAEDLYGPLNTYKTIENNSSNNNTIVMGPWTHGAWAREPGQQTVNHIYFGDSISTFYQRSIERPFFNYYLKDQGEMTLPEAYMFNTGTKKWEEYDVWPPVSTEAVEFFIGENEFLSMNKPTKHDAQFSYVSDPAHPVPYRSTTEGMTFTPTDYMTDDQRHASRRTDVLTFETEILENDLTLAGEILADLVVSMTGTDADFVVKLIDVYPADHPAYSHNPKNIEMGHYQQLVRAEVFRGRFRNSYEKPEPFVPGTPSNVRIPLQDILHTFKKGHSIMIQIHSTWFPYIDRNPQKYVENIYKADESDFIKSEITIHGSSSISVGGDLSKRINR